MIRLWLLAMLLFASCSSALGDTMSLSCALYNSEDSLAVSLDGENFDFKGSAILEPTSLYYKNGGGSTQPECSYSYGMSFNGAPLASGAESDSGAFSWRADANSNYCGDGARSFELSAKNMVNDGVLSSYYANSDHRVEEVVEVEGAQYVESLKLSEDEMNAKGRGSSCEDEFFYSFAQTMDEEALGSKAEVDSGASAWVVSVEPDEEEGSEETSTLFVTNIVEDGSMKSSYFNPDLQVEETVETQNAVYLQKETISHEGMDSRGNGVTIMEEDAAQEEQPDDSPDGDVPDSASLYEDLPVTKGLRHSISAKDSDNWGEISADVKGDTEVQWVSGVKSDASKYSLGIKVEGYGTTSEMDQLKVIGRAKDFPTQTLPAGSVDISFDYPYQDKAFLDSLDLYYEEGQNFCEDYQIETSPALYYYLNQKTYINPFEIPPDPDEALLPEDHYRMNMAFTINDA